MSNGNTVQFDQILSRVLGAGSLDQAPTEPQEIPQEEPDRKTQFDQILSAALVRPDITTAGEGRFTGFLKGAAEGATIPLAIIGLDVDLPPTRIGGFTREAATGSRILGNLAGVVAGSAPFFIGAKAALGVTGLAAALTETQLVVARGALAFGAFEAGAAEELRDIPERFIFGAVLGGAGEAALSRVIRAKSASKLKTHKSPRSAGVADEAIADFVATGKTPREGPIHVTPSGVILDAGTAGPVAKRAVELADNVFLPREVSFEEFKAVVARAAQPIDESTLGSGEAFLFVGEADTQAGRALVTSGISDDVVRGRLFGPDGIGPEINIEAVPARFGTRELANGFEFPITRAEGKPVRYNPETGEAVIRFTPAEKEAFAQAFEATGFAREFLAVPGDFSVTASEGQILRSVLTRSLSTKFEQIESLAELNEVIGVATAIDEFQALQLATSKFDVFRPPIETVVEDLKAIKLLESAGAKQRAIKEPRLKKKGEPQTFVAIDADALALEQSLTGIGEDSFGDAVTVLAGVGKNLDEQLEVTVAKLSLALNNGGMSLSGIDPAGASRITREIRRQFPTARVRVHKRTLDEHWLLVVDEEIVGPKALIKETLVKEERAVMDGLVKDGGVEDWERVREIIEADIAGELIEPPTITDVPTDKLLGRFIADRPALTTTSTTLNPAIVSVSGIESPFQNIRTLVHEYTHNLWAADVVDLVEPGVIDIGSVRGIPVEGTFRSVFRDFHATASEAEWTAIFGSHVTKDWKKLSEVGKLSAWAEVADGKEVTRGIVAFLGRAKSEGVKKITADPTYFFADNELGARAMDVIFTNRKAAQALAPNATRLMLKWAAEKSPKMQLLLGDKRLARIDEILNEVAFKEVVELQTRVREFGILKTAPTNAELDQFAVQGFFEGMLIHRKGLWSDSMIALRREGPDLVVRERWSLAEHTIPWNKITSTDVLPSKALTDEGVVLIRNKMGGAQTVQVPLKILGTERVAMTRVSLGGIEILEDVNALRQSLIKQLPKRADDIAFMPDGELFEFAGKLLGVKGKETRLQAIRHDDGMTLILPRTLPEPGLPEQILPAGAVETVAGEVGGRVVHLTPRQLIDSTLRDAGLNARDRVFVTDQVLGDITKDFMLGLPEDVFAYPKAVEMLGRAFGTDDASRTVSELRRMGINADERNVESFFHSNSLKSKGRQAGFTIREAVDGKFLIESEEGLVAGVFDRAGAEEWIARAGRKRHELTGLSPESLESDVILEMGEADLIGQSGASFDAPPSGPGKPPARPTGDHSGFAGGGGSEPPKFGETFGSNTPQPRGWADRFVSGIELLTPFMTGMETMSLTVERVTGVAANTKIFAPLQKAVRTIDRVMNEGRAGLKGKSLQEQLSKIEKLTFKLSKKQDRENVSLWMEALSKEEIAGGLMSREMNGFELGLSKEIERLGLAHEMPRLIATHRMMKNLVSSRKAFMKRFNSLSQQELPPEVVERLQTLFKLSRSKRQFDFSELAAELNLNEGQARMIQIIEALGQEGLKADQFSLMAVIRHASAENLPDGFKSMRDVMAKRLNLSETQLSIGREVEVLFDETFRASGIDPRRYIRGYFPHMRLFAREGILPNDAIMRDLLPREAGFAARKFRTGELDIYAREPLTVAVKNVRGMLMQQHFDPLLKEARVALRELRLKDERSFRIMREYVNELQGKSHDSFRQLQTAITSSSKAMGIEVDKDLARKVINTLASLSYQALIPFRAGLIARNYFQMAQMIPGRTGGKNFVEALRMSIGKDGYEAARRAGAITENVAPVISQEATLGFDQTFRLSRRLQMVSNVGFRWYQKADDLGRAVAFHGQRLRTGKAIDEFKRGIYGTDKVKSVQTMLQKAGVKTFDPIHQKQFETLFRAGKTEEAKDLLGVLLSRQTIFRYGHANHPAGWGSVAGRLFGQFGTWPIQYKDYLVQGLTRGTRIDKAQFVSWHAGMNLGMLAGGASIGYDLNSWVSFPALLYTGGPFADIAIDMTRLVGGNKRERSMALRSLKFQFVPTFSDPRAIWLPGSYAVGDLARTWAEDGGFDEALGFRKYEGGNKVLDALGFDD